METYKPITIAIDGYSSTGKSTMAKALAKKLGYRYIDTGAMYRAVALYALRKGFFNQGGKLDTQALIDDLPALQLRFGQDGKIRLNGEEVEGQIRNKEVSGKVSMVATVPEVRHKLVAEQQSMGTEGGIVMDGRDIGSVVFPDAELKIFMTADPKVRAQRRYDELLLKGESWTMDEVFENLRKRDEVDTTRAESPLIQVEDALLLDNSELSQEEQLRLAENWARERGA